MTPSFALLVAAAVVFAPGWYGEGPPQPPRGSDLAARVLAPTVDQGSIRTAVADAKDQLGSRQSKRHADPVSTAAATLGFSAIASLFFWIIVPHAGSVVRPFLLRAGFSRAPPRLQPA